MKDFNKEATKQGKNWYSNITKKRLLSPTYLLRPLNHFTLGKIPEHILATARERGKDIATAIEIWETHKELMLDNKEYMPMFEAYKRWKKKYKIKVLETEYHVVDHKQSTHGYIDLMVEYEGKVVAVEIKTRKTFGIKETDLIQNKIYKNAIPKTPFYILQISPNGDYKFEKFRFTKHIETKIKTLKNFRAMLGSTKLEGDEKK